MTSRHCISEVIRRQSRRTVISAVMRQLCSCETSPNRKSCNEETNNKAYGVISSHIAEVA